MRIDFREVEFPGDGKDHGPDGREPAITAGLAFLRLEKPVPGFQEAVGGLGLRPGDDAFPVAADEAGHPLHGLDPRAADVRAPLPEQGPHDIDLFAVQDLAVHLGPGGAPGRDLRHQGLEVIPGGSIQVTGVLEQRPPYALQDRITLLRGPPGEIEGVRGMGNDVKLVEGDPGVGKMCRHPVDERWRHVSIDTDSMAAGPTPWALISVASRSMAVASRSAVTAITARRAVSAARLLGSHQTTRIIGRKEFLDDWPRIQEAVDQPSVDGANTWLVSKATREVGLKVALSGVGGDELFGGYSLFREIPRWVRAMRRFSAIPLARPCGYLLARAGITLLPALSSKLPALFRFGECWEGAYFARRGLFMPWELPRLLDRDFAEAGLESLNPLPWQVGRISDGVPTDPGRVMLLEATGYLRNQLLRDADWASMDHGLELRTPLVDWHLFGATAGRLAERKLPGKDALVCAPSVPLPASQVARCKTGFGLPLGSWLPERDMGSEGGAAAHLGVVSRRLAVGQLGQAMPFETARHGQPGFRSRTPCAS